MNIAVAQSGGPTCAINASLLGVFKGAIRSDKIDIVFGSLNGIEGIINDDLIILNDYIKTYLDFEKLRQTPSTVLNSCRYKLPEYTEDWACFDTLEVFIDRFGEEKTNEIIKVFEDNFISVSSPVVAYGIYSSMSGNDVNATYNNNNIEGVSDIIYGMELAGSNETVTENTIVLNGNKTTGIAAEYNYIEIVNNNIKII